MAAIPQWLPWALLSAVFAALTAVLAKAGLLQVDSDLATLLRTALVLVLMAGKWQIPLALTPATCGGG